MKYAFSNVVDSVRGTHRYAPCVQAEGCYPVDLDFTLDHIDQYYSPRDEKGIPVKLYKSVGARYNPTRVAAFGLASWNRYLVTREPEMAANLLASARWFMEVDSAWWAYDFDWAELKAPWYSCMAQGEGISVLVRAFQHTGDQSFLTQARRAVEPMAIPVEEGGVRSILPTGDPFLEEYPSLTGGAHTLNGFLYAMIGLTELSDLSPGVQDEVGVLDLVGSLCDNIGLWSHRGWSLYDAKDSQIIFLNYASLNYHNLHITQLRYLASKYDRRELATVADEWESSARRVGRRMAALAGKIVFRIINPPQR